MRSQPILVAALSGLFAVLCSQGVPATTRLVPSQYANIQAAVNVSQEGDTVIVSPGIYKELVEFRGRNINLRSEDPNDPAIVSSTIIGDTMDQPTGNYGIKLLGTETIECLILQR